VRFTPFHPVTQVENFSLNLLLRNVPFLSWRSLFSPENPNHSFFLECQIRGLLYNEQTLDQVLQEYVREQLLKPSAFTMLKQRFLVQNPFAAGGPPVPQATVQAVAERYIRDMHSDLADVPDHSLTDAQQAVIDAITAGQRGIFVVSGCGGSGKTHLAKVLHTIMSFLSYSPCLSLELTSLLPCRCLHELCCNKAKSSCIVRQQGQPHRAYQHPPQQCTVYSNFHPPQQLSVIFNPMN
jgi:hypothetical protein